MGRNKVRRMSLLSRCCLIAPLVMVMMGVFVSPSSAQKKGARAKLEEKGSVTRVVVMEGTVIPVKMDNTLSSATSRVGNKFTATIRSEKEGDAEFPQGTRIEGVVREVRRMQKDQPGMLDVDFTTVRLPDGQTYRVEGSLTSLDDKGITRSSDGRLVTKTKSSNRTKFIAYGAGAGLLIGVLTKHTLVGTLLGAAAGYIYSQSHKDKESLTDVTVKAGTEFGVRLDREVAYNANRRFVDTREDYRAEQRRVSESSQDGSKNNRVQSKDINVTLNGRAVSFVKSRPVEENGYVLVPLDPVMKAAGVSYNYNERQEVVRVQTNQGNIRIKIGKPFAWIDKDKENIEGPAQLRNGEVFVPLHFLAIATEMRVIWDEKSRTVTMTSLSGRVVTQR